MQWHHPERGGAGCERGRDMCAVTDLIDPLIVWLKAQPAIGRKSDVNETWQGDCEHDIWLYFSCFCSGILSGNTSYDKYNLKAHVMFWNIVSRECNTYLLITAGKYSWNLVIHWYRVSYKVEQLIKHYWTYCFLRVWTLSTEFILKWGRKWTLWLIPFQASRMLVFVFCLLKWKRQWIYWRIYYRK